MTWMKVLLKPQVVPDAMLPTLPSAFSAVQNPCHTARQNLSQHLLLNPSAYFWLWEESKSRELPQQELGRLMHVVHPCGRKASPRCPDEAGGCTDQTRHLDQDGGQIVSVTGKRGRQLCNQERSLILALVGGPKGRSLAVSTVAEVSACPPCCCSPAAP